MELNQIGKDRIPLTWYDYQVAFDKIKVKILSWDSVKLYDGIYAVPRGGLILGINLSNIFQLPLLMAPTNRCIIVDDIYDTGTQLNMLYEKYVRDKGSEILVWYINKERAIEAKRKRIFWVKTKLSTQWLEFPWEY